jgi:putative addiction module component (TIGR02574 family)
MNAMKPGPTKLLEEALRLPAEAQAALAGSLLESLDGSVDQNAEAAWETEMARRVAELDSAKTKTIPWSQARRMHHGLPG